jgi:predicted transcriptional regulator
LEAKKLLNSSGGVKGSPLTFERFVASMSLSMLSASVEAEKRALWNTRTIRKEGREPELRDIKRLYDKLKELHEGSAFHDGDCRERTAVMMTAEVFRRTGAPADNDRLIEHIGNSARTLLAEEVFFDWPQLDWNVPLDLEDGVALRNYLERKRHFLLYAESILELWCDRFVDMWGSLFHHLPDRMFVAESQSSGSLSLTTPLWHLLEKPAEAVECLLAGFSQDAIAQHYLFEPLLARAENNLFDATGVPFEERGTSKRQLVLPTKCREQPELIPQLYLRDTPFLDIFREEVVIDVPNEARFEHAHVVAGTGHGKTQLFQHLISRDLEQVQSGKASIVVIDSQGDLIQNISRLSVFAPDGPLYDRLVLVDPTDVAYPVALNMFDMNTEAPTSLQQEKLLNGVLELYDYIFGSLLGAELTQKQGVIFRYVARLLLLVPGASVQHLRRLMEDDGLSDFAEYIPKLDSPTARTFFENEFNSREFDATKKQVRRRLWGILENKTFEHMFSYPHTKLRLGQEMNAGKVILINTSKDLLKQAGTEIFGRFFVALITQAALERASLPNAERKDTFVYIDEANDYFQGGDENLPIILEQARKYRISMTLAHQYLDQLDNKLKASFAANTSTKIVGGVSDKDARSFASEMRTSPDVIAGMRKLPDHSEFAIAVKNVTGGTMRLSVPFAHMESMPHMSEAEFELVRARQRDLYCVPVEEVRSTLAGVVDGGSAGSVDNTDADEIAIAGGWKPADDSGGSRPIAD